MKSSIHYTLCPADPKGHLFTVSLYIESPQHPVQQISLPNWIPGSYLIRDFSKHIIGLNARTQSHDPVELTLMDKSTWQFSCDEPVTLTYQVYAWDLSVRGAHFDESHAFFNGTSVFLAVDQQRHLACTLEIQTTEQCQQNHWQVATGLMKSNVNSDGFGLYQADNYDCLIDHPTEMGQFTEIAFSACGIAHTMVLTGLFLDLDEQRLKSDLIKICETEIQLFGEPAPMDNYLFQVMVTGSDYGGLEHRNSTALMCSRNDLPYKGMDKATDGYLQFLELCSHEYFHTWNVKRIQPAVYQNADLREPVYTNQLWWFEGITSYYDALILKRAGLVDNETYLKLLAQQMTRVYRMPGRFQQSVAESSLLTWTKFYQQDENAPNAIISYYTKGSLIALGLDLSIRQQTQGKKSLDDILLYLWQHHGQTGIGLHEGEIESICSKVSGIDLTDFFKRYLYGTQDIPFETLFQAYGIDFKLRKATTLDDLGGVSSDEPLQRHLGANLENTNQQSVKITHVWQQQAAYNAGLSAGDELIAINHIKINNKQQIETLLKRSGDASVWQCHYFRRDELRCCDLVTSLPVEDRVSLMETSTPPSNSIKWL